MSSDTRRLSCTDRPVSVLFGEYFESNNLCHIIVIQSSICCDQVLVDTVDTVDTDQCGTMSSVDMCHISAIGHITSQLIIHWQSDIWFSAILLFLRRPHGCYTDNQLLPADVGPKVTFNRSLPPVPNLCFLAHKKYWNKERWGRNWRNWIELF